jgi:hypothetical protein
MATARSRAPRAPTAPLAPPHRCHAQQVCIAACVSVPAKMLACVAQRGVPQAATRLPCMGPTPTPHLSAPPPPVMPLPSGRFGSSSGLPGSVCSGPCSAGHYCPLRSTNATSLACGNSTVFCPAGAAVPVAAPVGRYTVPEDGPPSVRVGTAPCVAGEYCAAGLRQNCSGGTYSSLPEQAACATCPPGAVWWRGGRGGRVRVEGRGVLRCSGSPSMPSHFSCAPPSPPPRHPHSQVLRAHQAPGPCPPCARAARPHWPTAPWGHPPPCPHRQASSPSPSQQAPCTSMPPYVWQAGTCGTGLPRVMPSPRDRVASGCVFCCCCEMQVLCRGRVGCVSSGSLRRSAGAERRSVLWAVRRGLLLRTRLCVIYASTLLEQRSVLLSRGANGWISSSTRLPSALACVVSPRLKEQPPCTPRTALTLPRVLFIVLFPHQGTPRPLAATPGYYTLLGPGAPAASSPTAAYQSTQLPCPPGHFCTLGVKAPCPPGVFGATPGLASPLCSGPCAAG